MRTLTGIPSLSRTVRILVVAALLALLWPVAPGGAVDEQARFLEVRRKQIELKSVRSERDRIRELFDQGLVARTQLERAEVAVETAQLDYQEAVLSLLSLEPRVTVERAVKHEAQDGRKLVRLTVTNRTPTFDDGQFELLSNFEGADPIPAGLRTRDLRDVFVSLKATGEGGGGGESVVGRGTTIALPYEVHVARLDYGASKSFEFQLLRDVTSVLVSLGYKGQQREIDIQLQQAETHRLVTVTPAQISQEADLGGEATFELELERSTVDSRRFQLGVVGLPRQVAHSFVDPASQARLSQISFAAGVTHQALHLRLFLPERADEELAIDQPLAFWVVVGEPGTLRLDEAASAAPGEVADGRAGRARLEMIPRGVGRIEVTAPSLFTETVAGGAVETHLTITNSGTRRLDNVQLTAESPLRWRTEIEPSVIPALDIRGERNVVLRVLPPADTPVGDYEVRLATESTAYNRRVPTEEKIFRISVQAERGLLGISVLVSTLLVLVLGVVTLGVRLTRR